MNPSDFKDASGRWRTASLFYENYTSNPAYPPMYTLKDEDIVLEGRTLPSFLRLYLELGDPTEWKVATQLLGGWKHWMTLCNSPWFKDIIESLRYQLEIKLRSESLERIISNKADTTSMKYIASGDYKNPGKGRPSKKDLEKEKTKQVDIQKKLIEDAERIGLNIVKETFNG